MYVKEGAGELNSRREFDPAVTLCSGRVPPQPGWPFLWLSLCLPLSLPLTTQRIMWARRNEKQHCALLTASCVCVSLWVCIFHCACVRVCVCALLGWNSCRFSTSLQYNYAHSSPWRARLPKGTQTCFNWTLGGLHPFFGDSGGGPTFGLWGRTKDEKLRLRSTSVYFLFSVQTDS